MVRRGPTSALVPAAACALLASLACRAVTLDPPPGEGFRSLWSRLPDRTWIGPDFWANRLQDWRVAGGRVECVEASAAAGLRTLHVVTHSLAAGETGSFRAEVRLGAIESELPASAASCAGFLVGAGGAHVDHRLSAQVHGAPAEDGGLLAVIDGTGRVAFRDLSGPARDSGAWAVRMDGDWSALPEPSGVVSAGLGFDGRESTSVALELVAARYDGRRRLTLVARVLATGEVLSTAVLEDADPAWLDGAVALVSHRGPEGGELGHWFRSLRLTGDLVEGHPERSFGPVLSAQYTLDETGERARDGEGPGVDLTLTAQMPPLGNDDTRTATLEIERDGELEEAARAELYEDSETFTFRVAGLGLAEDARYRIVYDLVVGEHRTVRTYYEGTLRAGRRGREVVVADVGCAKHYTGGLRWNSNGLWFPHAEVVSAVLAHDPDLVFFSGDQVYEGDLTPAVRAPDDAAMGDYLTKWYRWCWSFRELCRDRPCVVLPDDHDVYQGNLWGNGGVRGPARVTRADGSVQELSLSDRGGYAMSPRFVNAVHRTQTSHLPPAHTPEPIGPGISVFHTGFTYAGVSFAVVADRMWKSPPAVLVPEGQVRNGWFQDPGLDPREADVAGAELLGARQLAFLDEWAADWSAGAFAKVVLSATPFASIATAPPGATSDEGVPERPIPPAGPIRGDEVPAADCDSGGWPQSARDEALRRLRRAAALHLAGDQHLGATIRYGIDAFGDAGYCLSAPAVANAWPRRWAPAAGPASEADGAPHLGEHFDGFGNRMTVLAVANPAQSEARPRALHERAPGYGIARLDPVTSRVALEAWPRAVDPRVAGARPYEGWPVTFALAEGDGRAPAAHLSELAFDGAWVIQVEREPDDATSPSEVLYTRRVKGPRFRPPVFDAGARYTVRADPDGPAAGGRWAFERRGLAPGTGAAIALDR